eukprot:scaffold1839_cov382-Prasinococcus_capsulatus_cf.AAC.27
MTHVQLTLLDGSSSDVPGAAVHNHRYIEATVSSMPVRQVPSWACESPTTRTVASHSVPPVHTGMTGAGRSALTTPELSQSSRATTHREGNEPFGAATRVRRARRSPSCTWGRTTQPGRRQRVYNYPLRAHSRGRKPPPPSRSGPRRGGARAPKYSRAPVCRARVRALAFARRARFGRRRPKKAE